MVIGEVKAVRGKIHDYLGMTMDFSERGQVTIDMTAYVKSMIENLSVDLSKMKKVASPWNDNLFKVSQNSPKLNEQRASEFHTMTAQGLFLCKRARPDITPVIAFLTTRVQAPNQEDWTKLMRLMKFLQQTVEDKLTLRSDGSRVLKWGADASFAVHAD